MEGAPFDRWLNVDVITAEIIIESQRLVIDNAGRHFVRDGGGRILKVGRNVTGRQRPRPKLGHIERGARR